MKKRRILTLLLMLVLMVIPFSTFANPDTDQYDEDGFPIPRTLDEDTPVSEEDLIESWYANNIYYMDSKGGVIRVDDSRRNHGKVLMNVVNGYKFDNNIIIRNFKDIRNPYAFEFDINTNTNMVSIKSVNNNYISNVVSNPSSHRKKIEGHNTSDYNEDGWQGTLQRKIKSGSAAHTKEVDNENSPNYNKNGYTGTLQPYDPGDGSTKYRGQVSKPDDRVIKYDGEVYAMNYEVNFEYFATNKTSGVLKGEIYNFIDTSGYNERDFEVILEESANLNNKRYIRVNTQHVKELFNSNISMIEFPFLNASAYNTNEGYNTLRVNSNSNNKSLLCENIKATNIFGGYKLHFLNKCKINFHSRLNITLNRGSEGISYSKNDLEIYLNSNDNFYIFKNNQANQSHILIDNLDVNNISVRNIAIRLKNDPLVYYRVNSFTKYTTKEGPNIIDTYNISIDLLKDRNSQNIFIRSNNKYPLNTWVGIGNKYYYLGEVVNGRNSYIVPQSFRSTSTTSDLLSNTTFRPTSVEDSYELDPINYYVRYFNRSKSKLDDLIFRSRKNFAINNGESEIELTHYWSDGKARVGTLSSAFLKSGATIKEIENLNDLIRINNPFLKRISKYAIDKDNLKQGFLGINLVEDKVELNNKRIILDIQNYSNVHLNIRRSTNRLTNYYASRIKNCKITRIGNKITKIIPEENDLALEIDIKKLNLFSDKKLFSNCDIKENGIVKILEDRILAPVRLEYKSIDTIPIKLDINFIGINPEIEALKDSNIVFKFHTDTSSNLVNLRSYRKRFKNGINIVDAPTNNAVNTKLVPIVEITNPIINKLYEQKTFNEFSWEDNRENYLEDIVIPITIGPKNAFTGTVTWNGKPYNATQTITAKHNGQQFTTVEVTPNDTTYVAENPPSQDTSQYSIEASQIPFTRTEIDGLNITNTYLGRTENMFVPVTYPLNTQINSFYIKLGNSITKVDPVSFTTRPKTTEILTKVHTLDNVRFDDMQGNILMHKIQFSKSEAGPWTDSLTDGQFSITSQTPQSKVQATCSSYSTTNTDLCGNNGKYSAPSVTIAYTPETKTIGGTLTWANEVDGQSNRYNLNLQLNDANNLQVPHTNSNYQFAGTFPVTNEYGEEIQYTVTQKAGTESQHYRFQVDPSNFNITMTYKPPGIDKFQALEWSGGENDASFKVKCKVLKDGQLHEEKDIIRGAQECRFERLPEDDGHGHTYNYTIQITSDKGHTITTRSGQATLITYVPKQEQFSFAAELNGGYKLITRLQAELWERHGVTDKKLKDIVLTKEATAETFQPIQETLPLTTQDGTTKEYYLKNPTQVDAFNVTVRNNMALKTFHIIPTFTNKTTTLTWKTRFIGGESLSLTPKYQIKRDSFTETITGNAKPNDYSNFDQSQFTHTISTLKKYDETGLVINWRDHLKAVEVPERWQVRFQGDTATWTYTPPQTTLNIEAEITGGHTLLTSLTADIYEQYGSVNRKVKTVTLTKAKNDAQFQPITETLPQFSSGGEQITYTLKNPSQKDAFEISVRPSTTTIVANFINAKTTLTWKTQFRGGETLDLTPKYFIKKDDLEITITANDKPHSYDNFNQSQFTHTEMHLDKYNADGTTINWLSHIRPHQVPSEWTAEFHGDIATWTYNIPKTSKTFKVKAKEAVSLNLMNKGTVAYTKGITADNTQVIFSDINQTNTKGEEIEYTLALADTVYFEMNYDQDTETYIIERKAIPVPPPASNNNQNFKTQDVRIKVIWETPNKVNLPIRVISGSYRSEPHYFGNGSNKEETYTFNGVRVYNGNFSLDVTTPTGYSTSKVDANTIKVIKVNSIISDSSNSSTGTSHSNNANSSNSTNQSNTTPSNGSPGNPITIGSESSSSNSSNTSNSTESNESSRDSRDDRSSRDSRDDRRDNRDNRSSSDDRVTETSTTPSTNTNNTTKPSAKPTNNTTRPSTDTAKPTNNTTKPSTDITKPTANTNNTTKPFNPFKPAEDSPTVDPYNPSINTTDPAPMRETPNQFKPSEPFISDTVAGKKVEEPKVPDKITEITTESNIKGNIDPYIPPEVNSKPVKSTQQKQQTTQQQPKQPKKSKTAQLLTRDSNTKATQNEDIDLSFLNDPSEVNPADTIETKSNKQDKKQQLLTQGQDATTVQSSVIYAYNESGQPIYQPITQPIGTDEDGQPIYGYDSNGDPIYEPVTSPISESNQTTLSPEESEPIAYTEDGRPIYAFTENGQPIFEPLIEPTSYTEDGTPIYGYNDKGKPILRNVRVEGFQASIKKVTDKAKNLPLPVKAAAGGGVLVIAISGAFIFLKRR